MKEKILNCDRARTLCIVSRMARLGHFPVRQTEKEAWFLSPFRSETQASFKVSRTLKQIVRPWRGNRGEFDRPDMSNKKL